MNKTTKTTSFNKLMGNVSIAFVTLMVSFFPVYVSDKYYYIRHDKLYTFYVLASFLVICLGGVFITHYNSQKKETKIIEKPKNKLSVTDYGIITFLFVSIISTIFSQYKEESFTGSLGRNNGLLLTIAYCVVYFIISRTYKENKIVPMAMALTSSVVSFIGILQQFYWDPLDMYSGLSSNQYTKFLSTIGNRNIFSAYLTIVMPLCMVLFIFAEYKYEKITYAVSTVITFGGIVCCNSDSSILGTIAVFVFCYLFFIRNLKYFSKLLFITSLMAIGCKLIRIFSYIMDDYSMKFSSIQKYLVYGNTYFIIGITLGLSILLYILSKKNPQQQIPKTVVILFLVTLIVTFALAIFTFCYFTFIDTETKLSGFMTYFRFNDSWGTHRGFMWIRSIYIFINASIFQKIFGTGCDTFGQVMTNLGYNNELMTFKNETTNAAHNVYLNYLVTLGLAGVCSYITFIVSAVIRGIKKGFSNKYCIIFVASIISYSVQSIVNIDQPITTPLFIVVVALLKNQIRITK